MTQTQIPVTAQTQGQEQTQGQNQGQSTGTLINLQTIKTPSGKTIADFRIPQELLEKDPELVDLIIRSESMDDKERQYWFNLTEVMNTEQTEKLRDILVRERKKLAEIDAKYSKKKEVDPVEAAKKAQEMAQKRAAQQELIRKKKRNTNCLKKKMRMRF